MLKQRLIIILLSLSFWQVGAFSTAANVTVHVGTDNSYTLPSNRGSSGENLITNADGSTGFGVSGAQYIIFKEPSDLNTNTYFTFKSITGSTANITCTPVADSNGEYSRGDTCQVNEGVSVLVRACVNSVYVNNSVFTASPIVQLNLTKYNPARTALVRAAAAGTNYVGAGCAFNVYEGGVNVGVNVIRTIQEISNVPITIYIEEVASWQE